jgi:hypothetical protein
MVGISLGTDYGAGPDYTKHYRNVRRAGSFQAFGCFAQSGASAARRQNLRGQPEKEPRGGRFTLIDRFRVRSKSIQKEAQYNCNEPHPTGKSLTGLTLI